MKRFAVIELLGCHAEVVGSALFHFFAAGYPEGRLHYSERFEDYLDSVSSDVLEKARSQASTANATFEHGRYDPQLLEGVDTCIFTSIEYGEHPAPSKEFRGLLEGCLAAGTSAMVVVHNPDGDIDSLRSLAGEGREELRLIVLSRSTKRYLVERLGVAPETVLVMPVLCANRDGTSSAFSRPAPGRLRKNPDDKLVFSVIGDVARNRRDYAKLRVLDEQIDGSFEYKVVVAGWLLSDNRLGQLLGRHRMLRCLAFLLDYPQLVGLFLRRKLDLTLLDKSRLTDACIHDLLDATDCLLDVQGDSYDPDSGGKTPGLLGLSLSNRIPIVKLGSAESPLDIGLAELVASSSASGRSAAIASRSVRIAEHAEDLSASFQDSISTESAKG